MSVFKAVDNHKQATARIARYHYAVGQGIPEHLYGEVRRRLDAADDVLRWGTEHGHERVKGKGVPANIQTRKLRRGLLVDMTLSHGRLWRVAVRCPGYHHEPAKDLTVVLQWPVDIALQSCDCGGRGTGKHEPMCSWSVSVNEQSRKDNWTPTLVTAYWNNPTDWHRLTHEDSQQYKN